ncbi:MAG: hypothetical protein JWR25_1158 [Noviherbaspirillum sp.]|nr:hypothetical protein [Noviherbaspirillum sp.]
MVIRPLDRKWLVGGSTRSGEDIVLHADRGRHADADDDKGAGGGIVVEEGVVDDMEFLSEVTESSVDDMQTKAARLMRGATTMDNSGSLFLPKVAKVFRQPVDIKNIVMKRADCHRFRRSRFP